MMLAGLLAGLVLLVEARTQSFYSFHLEQIEILPSEPSSTDDVEIRITGWLPTPCDPDVSFSDLHQSQEGDQTTFWATAITQVPERTICIQIVVPVFHSYQLGKLESGNYDFVLYACVGDNNACQSEKTVLARKSFSVTRLPCIAIESLTADKTDATLGDSVVFRFKVKNICTEADTSEVTILIKDSLGTILHQSNRQITVGPKSSREETFSFMFTVVCDHTETYTVTVQTKNDSKSVYVSVIADPLGLPFALDLNKNCTIDDLEIITALDWWVRQVDIPGYPYHKKINDSDIIMLIDLWVKQSRCFSDLYPNCPLE